MFLNLITHYSLLERRFSRLVSYFILSPHALKHLPGIRRRILTFWKCFKQTAGKKLQNYEVIQLFLPLINVERICFLIFLHPGRIRILLMPLTSNFSIRKRGSSVHICPALPQRYSRTQGASLCSGKGTTSLNSSESPAATVAQPATNVMLRE
jgi:hypothetical protein